MNQKSIWSFCTFVMLWRTTWRMRKMSLNSRTDRLLEGVVLLAIKFPLIKLARRSSFTSKLARLEDLVSVLHSLQLYTRCCHMKESSTITFCCGTLTKRPWSLLEAIGKSLDGSRAKYEFLLEFFGNIYVRIRAKVEQSLKPWISTKGYYQSKT